MKRTKRLNREDKDKGSEQEHGDHVRERHPRHFLDSAFETIVEQVRTDVEGRSSLGGEEVCASEDRDE